MINTVRPYESGDAKRIKPQKIYANDFSLVPRVESLVNSENVFCNTYLDENDTPIAIVGITLLWPGVCDVWGIVSDDVKKTPIAFHKNIKHALNFYAGHLRIKRYQIYIKIGYKEGRKWAEKLGFRVEGALDYFGPDGQAYYIMGRINKCFQSL